jgi:SAM-dependent methyltransferase
VNDWREILERTGRYYGTRVRAYGATAQGVDWNSEAGQILRFDQFARLFEGDGPISINDYGCGYGALVDWLAARGRPFQYCGYDVAPDMIAAARGRHGGRPDCRFTGDAGDLTIADFTVASGIFNVKLEAPVGEWEAYVHDVIDRMAALSRLGFAFNVLTRDSDAALRRPTLFYADPEAFFTRCRARYSHAASLLQDYGLFEFTLLVRKDRVPA